MSAALAVRPAPDAAPRLIEAVLFDMDGTLIDTETVYRDALLHAIAAVGHSVSIEFCNSLIGIPAAESNAMIAAHLGPGFPQDEADRHYIVHRDRLLAEAVLLKPHALALLDALDAAGIRFAIATSSSRRGVDRHIGGLGLLPRFAAVACRDDVERGKPYPDLFLLAARRLGVAPDRCLVVEDSHNGVRAGHAAGMITVMVPDTLPPTEEIRTLATAILPDLAAVGAFLGMRVGDQAGGAGGGHRPGDAG